MATVVAKLLIQCEPDIAMFGEKDYQQLKVVTRLARDLDLKTRIVGAPIVREADGLALSSRNRYLSPRNAQRARRCYRVLKECAADIAAGKPIAAVLDAGPRGDHERRASRSTTSKRATPRRSRPSPRAKAGPIRLLVAARIGTTRLIDNVAV